MKKLFYLIFLVIAVSGVALQLWLQQRQRDASIQGALSESGPAAQAVRAIRTTQATGPNGEMAKFSTVPDFSLTDRTGAPVSRADLKGKVWLADFIYTTCPDTCPMLSSRFSKLQQEAFALGDVRFVSFSVDPGHDTPEVLQGYAKHLEATDRWFFLTGDKKQVKEIATKGFLLGFERAPGSPSEINHSTKIALVDKNGVVRRFYEGTGEDESAKILADVKTLLKEGHP